MIHGQRYGILFCTFLLCVFIISAPCLSAPVSTDQCPPIAFVKRPHFDRPFGIGSIIGWDIYKPGGGIYIYDPAHPERPAHEIFRRDDGVIFDMSASFDAKKLLFAWRRCATDETKKGPLTVSRVLQSDTIEHVMKTTPPTSSDQKPNHSFWDRKGQVEWAQVDLGKQRTVSQVAVYWFDDQVRNGGCKIPKSWKLLYRHRQNWLPVTGVGEYGTKKDCYNTLHFDSVVTDALKIELQCYPDKSAGIQRLRIGTKTQHADILAIADKREVGNPEQEGFHIYEINVDGSELRQLTFGPYNDIHPFYLPDGRVAFVSTRVKAYVMCQPGAACALHVMDVDGSNIKRIHFGTLADHSPYLLDDGSILFTRWEYQDKDLTYLQGLWTVNPDGTRVQLFFGNTILEPAVIWQAKPIPGTSDVLCTLSPHHGNPVGKIEGYACRIVVDEAISWLDEKHNPDKPFFLNIWFHEPHAPIAAPDEIVSQYGELKDPAAIYSGTIDNTDRAIVRLLKKLEEIDSPENTLIVYSSDNGSYRADRVGALRGKKGSNFEGGLRVPGIFYWPGTIKKGHVEHEPAGLVDLLATVCGLLGIGKPEGVHLDGSDLSPLLTGRADEFTRHQPLFWLLPTSYPTMAIRDGAYSLVAYRDYRLPKDQEKMTALMKQIVETLRNNDTLEEEIRGSTLQEQMFEGFKDKEAEKLRGQYVRLNMFQESWIPTIKAGAYMRFQLFDLTKDPGQQTDVSTEFPNVVARLKKKLLEINASVMADAPEWQLVNQE